MRRTLTTLILAGSALAAGPALAFAPSALATADPPAALSDFACQNSHTALNREISIAAVMQPRTGAQRELRFELQRRKGGQRFVDVRGGDLGRWIHPAPNVRAEDVWQLDKPVVNLTAPATYRFRVTFRWLLTKGHTDSVLYSPSCTQTGA